MHATNCPNCGAPITKPICEYCGTALANGGLVDHETTTLYSDGEVFLVINTPKLSEEMARAVADGMMSVNEARKMLYG